MSANANLGIIVAGAVGAFGSTAGMRPRRSIGAIIANITESETHEDRLQVTDHPVEQGAAITDHAFKMPAELTLRVAWSNSPGQPGSLLEGISGALTNALTGTVTNQISGAAYKQIGGSALGNLAVANLAALVANPLISFGATVNSGTGKGTSTVVDVYQQLLDLQSSAVPITVYTGKRRYDNMLITLIKTETDRATENALACVLTLRQVIIVQTTVVSVPAPSGQQAAPERTAAPTDAGTKQAVPVQADQNLELGRALGAQYPGPGRSQ